MYILVTKAIVRVINESANRCIVRMPLFETTSNSAPVEAEALVSITPGMFNNLEVGDIVFVAFEENAIEKPIIIGKLFTGIQNENKVKGGAGVLDTLRVRTAATIPCSTLYEYPASQRKNYKDLETPKKTADYIKWLESYTKKLVTQLDDQFKCFKCWVQWQFKPENIEVDDGDIDDDSKVITPYQFQEEGADCRVCGSKCPKGSKRTYLKIDKNNDYPKL